ncbi:sialidase family protein [Caloramator sp. mosi_1]|uniref:WD40/YVTN/BNR-like repeat-containing protein n=1 Tax=Caloramator sp. mosi_1 TaxID=3023090 RepID=UPI002362762B|nr:sialidase family protein [Caloramator sp. mosi_1]WDC85274.1 sialidase family protein [Caloramator sp. mosi_1]
MIMPSYKISAQEYIWNNIYSLDGAQFIYAKDNNYILISKKDGKSSVAIKSNNVWNITLKDIPEVRSIFEYNGAIYMLSSKDSNRAIYKSTDEGNTWSNILGTEILLPNNIGNNNVESIVISDEAIYINVNKQGIYVTYDKGQNWTNINNGLPIKNQTDFLSRNIWNIDGELYASTKDKNGLYKYHKDEGVWKPVKDLNGLPSGDAREVRDFVILNTTIYIGTNNGVWTTSALGDDPWVQVNGISGDIRKLLVLNGDLYAISKSAKQIYQLKNLNFEPLYNNIDSTLGDFLTFVIL